MSVTAVTHPASPTLRPRREDGTLDWVIIALGLALLLILGGVAALVWMFSNREYWASDPTMPSVFVMFSKIINGSTIGVLLIFIGAIIATAAISCAYFRQRHDRIMERIEDSFDQQDRRVLALESQLKSLLETSQITAAAIDYLAQRTAHCGEVLDDINRRIPHPVKNMRRGRPRRRTSAEEIKKAKKEGYANGYVDGVDTSGNGRRSLRVVKPIPPQDPSSKNDH